MFFVYILKSQKDNMLYTGFTSNVSKRLSKHNNGEVASTINRLPFELIYHEACENKTDALHREKYLKTSWGKRFVKNRLKCYLSHS